MNESSVPHSEARDKRRSRVDLATATAVVGIFKAILGALVTSVFDLGFAWQATATVVGGILLGTSGFSLMYLCLGFAL